MSPSPRWLALVLVGATLLGATARVAEPPGWIGVTLGDDGGRAARIAGVLPDSPALRAGLQAGDVVRAVRGRTVRSSHELSETVRRIRPTSDVPLRLERAGASLELTVTVGARPADVYRLIEIDRDRWQHPERVLDLLAIGPGETVADVGAGGGYFTERLLAAVGPSGHVIAVDVDPDALQQLTTRFAHARNVTVQRGAATDPRLAPATLDAALMVDTFHELEAPSAMLAAIRRALRPGGRLVVVDRPAAKYAPGTHAIPEIRVLSEAESAGCRLRERVDLPQQFAVVLECPG